MLTQISSSFANFLTSASHGCQFSGPVRTTGESLLMVEDDAMVDIFGMRNGPTNAEQGDRVMMMIGMTRGR